VGQQNFVVFAPSFLTEKVQGVDYEIAATVHRDDNVNISRRIKTLTIIPDIPTTLTPREHHKKRRNGCKCVVKRSDCVA
jgi:hypothetical protein